MAGTIPMWSRLLKGRLVRVALALLVTVLATRYADGQTSAGATEGHRALIVDYTTSPGQFRGPYTLRLVDLDSGKALAEASIGIDPDLALSSDGSTVAVVSRFVESTQRYGRTSKGSEQVQLFRTRDLSLITRSELPFQDRLHGIRTLGVGVIAFADGDRVLLIPRELAPPEKATYGNESIRWTPLDVERSVALIQAGQLPGNVFVPSHYRDVVGGNRVRHPFLTTRNWPQVDFEFRDVEPTTGEYADLIQVLDFERGAVADQRCVSPRREPMEGQQGAAFSQGSLLPSADGTVAYFLPNAPDQLPRGRPDRSGPLCRISMTDDLFPILQRGDEAVKDLNTAAAAVSEQAHTLIVAIEPDDQANPSLVFRVYDTTTLKPRGEIDTDMYITKLAFSHDGTQIYAAEAHRGSQTRIKVYRTSDLSLQYVLENMYVELAVFVPLPGSPGVD